MLRGESVLLTELRDADSPALFRWINDRELVELSSTFAPVDRESHERWFDDVRGRGDVEIFAIRTASDERLVGSCQLRGIDRERGTAELQIRIGERDAWGRGYGTEAVRLLLRRAFEELGLERVELQVFPSNARAIRAYEKAGFSRTGERGGQVVMAAHRPTAAA